MKLKTLGLAALVMVILGMFSACGGEDIQDAESLVKANKAAQEAVTSYHVDSDVDMEISMDMAELASLLGASQLSMPMDMKMSLDAGKESAHGTTSADITIMGQNQKVDAETYVDIKEGIVYTKADGTDTWTSSEQASSATEMIESISDMGDEVLSKAKFQSSDNSYTLTMTAADMGTAMNDLGLLSDIGNSGVELKDFSMTGGEIVYTFDKEKVLLQKIEMGDIIIKASGAMQGMTMDMDITMDGDYEISNYDKLDPKDYEIPEDVKKSASGKATTPSQPQATTEATKATEATQAPKGAEGGSLPKATTQLTVSGKSTPDGQGWYVVGQDSVPAGAYKLFHGEGQGVVTIKSSDHSVTKGDWTIGYGEYSKDKDLEDGTRVDLVDGDLIFITKDLDLVFDPVN